LLAAGVRGTRYLACGRSLRVGRREKEETARRQDSGLVLDRFADTSILDRSEAADTTRETPQSGQTGNANA